MASEGSWRFYLAAVSSVGILAVTTLVVSHPRDFEKLYLKTAGNVLGEFSDRLEVWIAVSVVLAILGWLGIAIACFAQRKPR